MFKGLAHLFCLLYLYRPLYRPGPILPTFTLLRIMLTTPYSMHLTKLVEFFLVIRALDGTKEVKVMLDSWSSLLMIVQDYFFDIAAKLTLPIPTRCKFAFKVDANLWWAFWLLCLKPIWLWFFQIQLYVHARFCEQIHILFFMRTY